MKPGSADADIVSPRSMPVWLLGGGGHSKVVVAALRAAGRQVAGIFDADPQTWGRQWVLDIPVVGDIPAAAWWDQEARLGFVAIGANRVRQKFADTFVSNEWVIVTHPAATVDATAKIGPGTLVCAGALIQPNVAIGQHVVINTGAIVDHDVRIGDFAFVAPGACLAGGVAVGEGAFIGINASILPGVSIGAWSTVGAGAVVLKDLPPHVTAVGVPARPVS